MQQFVADSPWDPALVVKAVAERVAPEIEVQAWVLDDTGFPKDGKDSPGVKRQYSGTLGKRVTADRRFGARHRRAWDGSAWVAVYFPEDWCEDEQRRRKAKIPDEVAFKTKPELGVSSSSAPPAGMCQRRLCPATTPTGRTPGCAIVSTRPGASTCCRLDQARRCSRKGPCSPCRPRSPRQLGSYPAAARPQARTDRRADQPTRGRQRANGNLP